MGDAHVMIVDHHRQHVGRRAVAAQQHHVVELLVADPDLALHQVGDHRVAGLRHFETDRRGHPGRRLGGAAVAPAAVIARRQAFRLGLVAHRLQLFRRAVAVVGVAQRHQQAGDLGMTLSAGELVDHVAVPAQPEPAQPVDDRVDRRLGRALAIGVLDAQVEAAAVMAGEQPVEQRRAGAADMKITRRRRGETSDDGHCSRKKCYLPAVPAGGV
jgi:hypothetical protein